MADKQSAGLQPSVLKRLAARLGSRSRECRYRLFLELMEPGPDDRLLDVGVTETHWRASNFLEAKYPWPERITAVALKPMPTFREMFPSVEFVVADGRQLPFSDLAFDIGFSNAVVEHVGSRAEQRQFVHELLRTCRRVFIATPNAAFPADPHTLLPFVHWLPRPLRHPILRWTGNAPWASEQALNPLGAADLVSLFPPEVEVHLERQRLLGWATVLIAVARR